MELELISWTESGAGVVPYRETGISYQRRGNVYWAGAISKRPREALCIITKVERGYRYEDDGDYSFISCKSTGRITTQVSGSKAGKEEPQW